MTEPRPKKSNIETFVFILKNENGLPKFITQYFGILFIQIYLSVTLLNSFLETEKILNSFLNKLTKNEFDEFSYLSTSEEGEEPSLASDYEVLTGTRSWVKISELKKTDTLAVLKEDKFIKYETPLRIYKKKYKGKMYCMKSKFVDVFVTPSHNLYIAQGHYFPRKGFGFSRADSVYHKYYIWFKKTAIWQKDDYQIVLPAAAIWRGPLQVGMTDCWELPMGAFLRFFGFWIAEGWITPYDTKRADNGVITISQTKPEGREYIEFLFDALDIKDDVVDYHRTGKYKDSENGTYVENKYRIYNKQLFLFLLKERKRAGYKRLPDWVWELSRDQSRALLEGLMAGDGDKRGTYYTASFGLADDVCRLLLHCEYAFTLKRVDYKPGWRSPFIKTITRVNFPQYRVKCLYNTPTPKANSEYRQSQKTFDDSYIDYDDYVYDIKTPSRVFYARRNGVGSWIGGVIRFKKEEEDKNLS